MRTPISYNSAHYGYVPGEIGLDRSVLQLKHGSPVKFPTRTSRQPLSTVTTVSDTERQFSSRALRLAIGNQAIFWGTNV